MRKLEPLTPCSDCAGRRARTTRISWTTNNAVPDSIKTNMTCRRLVLPLADDPKLRSIEVALTSRNTMRILNTIKPVTKVFTVMESAKLVREIGIPHAIEKKSPSTNDNDPIWANQVADR